jgi:hypothetical protein
MLDVIPRSCSVTDGGLNCRSVPSHIISITLDGGQYMIGTVCSEHFLNLRDEIDHLQDLGRIPKGKVAFQEVRTVATACFLNSNKNSYKI